MDGKLIPLSKSVLSDRFKEMLILVGLDPSAYSFHSLRHGGATLATKAGINTMVTGVLIVIRLALKKPVLICIE